MPNHPTLQKMIDALKANGFSPMLETVQSGRDVVSVETNHFIKDNKWKDLNNVFFAKIHFSEEMVEPHITLHRFGNVPKQKFILATSETLANDIKQLEPTL